MTGFEPHTSNLGRDCSPNGATTTAQIKKKEAGYGPFKKEWNEKNRETLSLFFQEAAAEEGAAAVQVLVAQGKTIDSMWSPSSVTRLGDLLDFWQAFKVFGNN